jgi:hypothetical protein
VIVRLLLLAALLALLLPAGATPAAAHAGGLTSAASTSRVVAIDPPLPGLDVRAVEFGARLRIDNATPVPVVVEPLTGSVVSGLPVVLPGGRAYWVDPRVMLAASAGPTTTGDRAAWTVPLRAGNVRVLVLGEQLWPPPPAPSWWVVAMAALLLPAAAGLVGAARPWGRRVLAASTAVVLAAHLVHVLGSALVPEDRPYPLMLLSAAGYALLGWPLGAIGGWLTLRGRPGGPLLCCVAGGLFALVIAPVDAFTLVDAVVPFAWGADLDRLVVALTLGGGLGVVVAGVAALRRGPVPAS